MLTAVEITGFVSTHSRPKAAGYLRHVLNLVNRFQHTAARRRLASPTHNKLMVKSVSTHSRPKAAGTGSLTIDNLNSVSTHSRPKAAGRLYFVRNDYTWRFNTQPPEGGWYLHTLRFQHWLWFQHTAARRRLVEH